MNQKDTRITIQIPQVMLRQVKEAAARNRIKTSQWLREAVEYILNSGTNPHAAAIKIDPTSRAAEPPSTDYQTNRTKDP